MLMRIVAVVSVIVIRKRCFSTINRHFTMGNFWGILRRHGERFREFWQFSREFPENFPRHTGTGGVYFTRMLEGVLKE